MAATSDKPICDKARTFFLNLADEKLFSLLLGLESVAWSCSCVVGRFGVVCSVCVRDIFYFLVFTAFNNFDLAFHGFVFN